MFCMAGHQMLAVRSGGTRSRETALGYYMVAASIGQGLGPFVVGSLGGSAALPPTGLLFAIGLIAAGASVIVALLIRPAAIKARPHETGDFIPIGRLLTLRGFPGRHGVERGDRHRAGSAGDLSARAGRGTAD